jgi:hypothetical protein
MTKNLNIFIYGVQVNLKFPKLKSLNKRIIEGKSEGAIMFIIGLWVDYVPEWILNIIYYNMYNSIGSRMVYTIKENRTEVEAAMRRHQQDVVVETGNDYFRSSVSYLS